MSSSAVLEDSEAVFADISVRLEKTKAEVREQEGWGRRSAPRHDAHKDCASGRFPWFQVRARLEARERAVVGRMERDVETLEKDLEELRRRDQEISQVLQSGDGANLFQVKLGERFIQLRFSNSRLLLDPGCSSALRPRRRRLAPRRRGLAHRGLRRRQESSESPPQPPGGGVQGGGGEHQPCRCGRDQAQAERNANG